MKMPAPISPTSPLIFEPLAQRQQKICSGELKWQDWLALLDEHIRREDPVFKGLAEWIPFSDHHPAPEWRQGQEPHLLVTYKDTIDVSGFPTRLGSSMGYRHYPTQSATVAERLHSQRIFCIGKAATLEFGLAPRTSCINPRFPMYSPGGSSTGSAVSVAAGFCDFSVGTDAGGSIRHPAGQCGVVGLKLSYNPALLEGIFPGSPHMDSVGIITRTVADLAYIWQREELDQLLNGGRNRATVSSMPRLGYVANCEDSACDPEVWTAWQHLLAKLALAELPAKRKQLDWWHFREQAWDLLLREVYDENDLFRRTGQIEYDDFAWESIRLGESIDGEQYEKIKSDQATAVAMAAADLAEGDVDVLLLPLDPHLPRHVDTPPPSVYVPEPHANDPGFTIIGNFTQIPVMALPIATSAAGAPIAVQLMARQGGEASLIKAGLIIEQLI